jgi:serine/threonine-protein kinase
MRPKSEPAPLPAIPGFEILSELGRGGMGVVYKARHISLNRLVALKMIRSAELANKLELDRFRAEAEMVARLHHPNVVQIFDIGSYDGLPYLSLEYVDGGSLGAYLHGEPQQPRPAAELTATLADAIHHAHQHGIVHRDLKPANILLEIANCGLRNEDQSAIRNLQSAIPKITDFGLAKRLDNDSGPTTSGQLLGTPSYMSPEQAGGRVRDIGPHTDVYALGVILYEMLTGRPPFKNVNVLDTLTQIQTVEPLAPQRLQPSLPTDLETICLKCLQKDSGKRYANAAALAEDLRRFLAGKPILARPVGAAAKTWRWCRRNPALAASCGLAALGIVAALTLSVALAITQTAAADRLRAEQAQTEQERQKAVAQAEEARKAQARAERNFQRAHAAVDAMLTQIGAQKLRQVQDVATIRRELLQEALKFHKQFLDDRSDDPKLQWELGRTYGKVGDIYQQLGQPQEAEKAFRKGIQLVEEVAVKFPQDAAYRGDLAGGYHNLGQLLAQTGRSEEAERAYQKCLTLMEQLDHESPTNANSSALATLHNSLGNQYRLTSRMAKAETEFQKALVYQERLMRDQPAAEVYRNDLARIHNNLAVVFAATGRKAQAEESYQMALAIREQLVHDFPAAPEFQASLAITQMSLSVFYTQNQQLERAEEFGGKAVSTWEKLAHDHPAVASYQSNLALACSNLGGLYAGTGRLEEAGKVFRRGLTVQEELYRAQPMNIEFGNDVGGSYLNLGHLQRAQIKSAEAIESYEKATGLLEAILKREPRATTTQSHLTLAYWGKAEACTDLERHAESLPAWNRALELDSEKRPAIRIGRALAMVRLGQLPPALEEAKALAARPASGEISYGVAAIHALAAAGKGVTAQDRARHIRQAVDFLRKAKAAGYFKEPQAALKLKHDADLDAVRQDDGFRALLAEVEGKNP